MSEWLEKILKRFKPDKLPQWAWGLILLSGAILAMLILQQVTGRQSDASTDLPALGSASVIFDIVIKLIIVLGLIFVSLYLLRIWRAKLPGSSDRKIEVLESRQLNAKQALHLIRIADRTLLIGATDQSLATLISLDGFADESDDDEIDFAQELEKKLADEHVR